MRIHAVVDRQFGVYVLQFDGITFDNRFLPTSWQPDPRWHLAVFVTRGAFTVGGERFERGEGFSAATETLAPRVSPEMVVRSCEPSSAVVALRLRPPFFLEEHRASLRRLPPGVRELPWLELSAAAEEPARGEGRVETTFTRVLDGLRDARVLDEAAPSPLSPSSAPGRVVSRIASTIFPTLSALATRPTMIDLMARTQLTERQLLRNLVRVQEDFELLDRGWRAAILRWRVTAGALLLSSRDISLAEVARLAGYSSTKAMARAFSDAGLPPPGEVRERIGKDAAALPPHESEA
jgi:AraC-like DNA-binding protein